ncbi:MAG: L-threonylcarbamoyladenylate synthase, partial [Bowdeniella nasicola]|nr:L-threonylcarbamoyladenylate synthase [Bowdeniella nasicola]
YYCQDESVRGPALDAAAYQLKRGGLIVMPTDTVYGIACDAFDPAAVTKLLSAKGRGRDMPPPVLVGQGAVLDALAAQVSEAARLLTEQLWPGALTVIVPAQPSLTWDLGETYGTVALRMPADELALELLAKTGPLAVSSANRSHLPPAHSAQEAEEYFGFQVPVYLDGGRRERQAPSTIVDCCNPIPRVVRIGDIDQETLRELVGEIEVDAQP